MSKEKKLSWLATFISEMYFPNSNAEDVYKQLKDFKEEDIENLLGKYYEKYGKELRYSKYFFCSNLMNAYNNISEQDTEEKERRDFVKLSQSSKGFSFENITYPLYWFTRKLYFSLLRDGAKRVFFLSREGQFMKKMFDAFQDKMVGPKIQTEYLYVSRASTFLGTLKDIEHEDFLGLLYQYANLSLKEFCKNLAFSDEEINELAKGFKYNFEVKIENIRESKPFMELLKNKYFIKLYDEKRKKSKDNFISYLATFGDDYKEQMFVVDVGWKGTIQTNIQKILSDTDVKGYYLGLMNYERIEGYNNKFPVLFEYSPLNKTANCFLYNSNRSIFEILLAADHGSTVNYEKNGGDVKPVLHKEELELKMFNEKIKPIQDNIFALFLEIVDSLNKPFYDIVMIDKIINNKFFELIFRPSKDEIMQYQSFYHFENFGVMNYSEFNNKKEKSFVRKIKCYLHFPTFIRNDDTWQYLKLYNENMRLGMSFLYHYKKAKFKKMDVL